LNRLFANSLKLRFSTYRADSSFFASLLLTLPYP
jgi:hypothetical protein